MKLHLSRTMLCLAIACAAATIGTAQAEKGRRDAPPPPAALAPQGVYTTVTGTVSQLNYDRDAEVEGFLLSNNTLVHMPPRVGARVATSIHTGDNVQIAGLAQTSRSGVQTVEAQRIQDRSSGLTLTVPQPGAAAPYSGSGRIQQLNYGPDGAVNGFVVDNGTLARVSPFAPGNPSSVRVGATVAYSGYARNTMSGRTVVDVQTLTINGQALSMNPAGRGEPAPPPPAPRAAGNPGAGNPDSAAPRDVAPLPAGRTAEPPPPPAPPQNPGS